VTRKLSGVFVRFVRRFNKKETVDGIEKKSGFRRGRP
jgi:hypothetical protein